MGASGPIVGVETFVGVLSEALPRRSSYIHFPLNPRSPGQRSRISIICVKTKPSYLPLPLDEIHFCRETIEYYVCSVGSIFLYFHIFHPDEANQARDPCNVLVVFPNNGAQTPCAILSYLKVFLFQIVSLN